MNNAQCKCQHGSFPLNAFPRLISVLELTAQCAVARFCHWHVLRIGGILAGFADRCQFAFSSVKDVLLSICFVIFTSVNPMVLKMRMDNIIYFVRASWTNPLILMILSVDPVNNAFVPLGCNNVLL